MKPFVHLRHIIGRVYLIIGIASLSIFTVATITLTSSPVAHAQAQSSCAPNYYKDKGICRPDGFCPTGTYVYGYHTGGRPICKANSTKKCPPDYYSDPDSRGCMPDKVKCGSASQLDKKTYVCDMHSTVTSHPKPYPNGH
jgi:hypothetical protein